MVQAFACTRYLITLSGFKTLTGLTALSTEAIQVYDEGKKLTLQGFKTLEGLAPLSTEAIQVYDEGKKTAEILLIIFGHSKIKKNEKYF